MDTEQNKNPEETDDIDSLTGKQWEGIQLYTGQNREPRGKLHCYNWLSDIPGEFASSDLVEVQFKNTRKGYYRNSTNLELAIGDIVAVEAQPGHDIGQVTMTGQLVELQMKKANLRPDVEIKRVFRKAKPADLEKFERARARETDTMIQSRKIAESLGLNMKIGDVEYQGDGNKAIFYYISDERVDFRKLIKILAETFKVRIEMKQIGARQEAGRIGGIGPCGRPLCCSSWMTNFVTVATSAARHQDLSLNPQKLAGQCAKLKCCLNFEVDAYVESVKRLPPRDIPLETADGTFYHFKTDIFKRELTYSTDKHMPSNLVTISADRVFEVQAMNKAGEKPLSLVSENESAQKPKKDFVDLVGQDSVTRFDKAKKKKKKSGKGGSKQPQDNQGHVNENGTAEKPIPPQKQQNNNNNRGYNNGNNNNGNNGNRNQRQQQRNRQRPRPPRQQE
ncbi:MAG: hypothetical protein NC343_00980 [Muribaculum sp.]|nr:hypothetical protein [Muribaculaceae bacterium]MCM1080309.1 hypothetical protein [Muribaculum sp.]